MPSPAATDYPSNGGIAEKIKPFVDDQTIAGAVIMVADKDKILDLETIGYADCSTKKPMRGDNLFFIASMTKTFTAAALMMLVDEGKINLDDPVEKYLPEFQGQMVQEQGGKPHPPKHPATIKEMMDHTAGLAGDNQEKGRAHSLEQWVKEIALLPLKWEPGSKYKYSMGPAVGGRIVEVVSGMSYTDFIQKRILDPLGLKATTFWPNEEQASHLALTHQLNPATKTLEPLHHSNPDFLAHPEKCKGVPPIILSQFPASVVNTYSYHFAYPTGSLYSTAADITRFCQMLLNNGTMDGKKYLSPQAVKLMSTDYVGELAKGTEGYGIGCFVRNKALPGEPSLGSYGHHGSRKTQMWIDPKNGLVMVIMLQSADLEGSSKEAALYKAYRMQAIARFGKTKE